MARSPHRLVSLIEERRHSIGFRWVLPLLSMFFLVSTACVPKTDFQALDRELSVTKQELAEAERDLSLARRAVKGDLIKDFKQLEKRCENYEQALKGLDRLTRELSQCRDELSTANATIMQYRQLQKSSKQSVIESKIDGNWNGWYGDTIFRLMNGQVWQQTGVAVSVSVRIMPDVLIFRDAGGWKAHIEGESRPVRVRQIK